MRDPAADMCFRYASKAGMSSPQASKKFFKVDLEVILQSELDSRSGMLLQAILFAYAMNVYIECRIFFACLDGTRSIPDPRTSKPEFAPAHLAPSQWPQLAFATREQFERLPVLWLSYRSVRANENDKGGLPEFRDVAGWVKVMFSNANGLGVTSHQLVVPGDEGRAGRRTWLGVPVGSI